MQIAGQRTKPNCKFNVKWFACWTFAIVNIFRFELLFRKKKLFFTTVEHFAIVWDFRRTFGYLKSVTLSECENDVFKEQQASASTIEMKSSIAPLIPRIPFQQWQTFNNRPRQLVQSMWETEIIFKSANEVACIHISEIDFIEFAASSDGTWIFFYFYAT